MNQWLHSLFGTGSAPLFDFFSTWGGPSGWLLVGCLVFWLSGSRQGLRVGFTLCLSGIANTYLKWLLGAPRPYYISSDVTATRASDGFGMPSGHSQGVAALWGAIGYLFRTWWVLALAVLFILLTGLARIYYGVHSPLQVAVGWVLGLAAVAAVMTFETPFVNWCRAAGTMKVVATVCAVGLLIIVVGLAISLGFRGGFETPELWQDNWLELAQRIAAREREPLEPFVLIEPATSVILACYFWGYAICALLYLRAGELRVNSHRSRLCNVLIGVPLIVIGVILSYLPDTHVGEVIAQSVFNLVLPSLAGFVVPRIGNRIDQ